jgi:hypothetical protein
VIDHEDSLPRTETTRPPCDEACERRLCIILYKAIVSVPLRPVHRKLPGARYRVDDTAYLSTISPVCTKVVSPPIHAACSSITPDIRRTLCAFGKSESKVAISPKQLNPPRCRLTYHREDLRRQPPSGSIPVSHVSKWVSDHEPGTPLLEQL